MLLARFVSFFLLFSFGSGCASTTMPAGGDPMGNTTTTHTHAPRASAQTAASLESCNGGAIEGCHAAALDAYYSPPSPDTNARALGLFRKACDEGYAPSCNGLGVLYQEGRGVVNDPGIAALFFRRACASDGSTGCQHLAQALRTGRGVTKDLQGAERAEARGKCLFEASLKKDDRSCPPLEAETR